MRNASQAHLIGMLYSIPARMTISRRRDGLTTFLRAPPQRSRPSCALRHKSSSGAGSLPPAPSSGPSSRCPCRRTWHATCRAWRSRFPAHGIGPDRYASFDPFKGIHDLAVRVARLLNAELPPMEKILPLTTFFIQGDYHGT